LRKDSQAFAVDFGRTTRTPPTVGEPAGVLFRGNCGRSGQFLDGPRRREAAAGHRLFDENGQLRPTGKWPPHELSSVNSASAMNVSFIWSPSRWADESKQTLTLEIGIERQGRTDLHRPLNTVLKKPRRPACRRGSLCAQAGRPIRPNTNVPGNLYLSGYRNWYLSG
jgi:hypothetical protein